MANVVPVRQWIPEEEVHKSQLLRRINEATPLWELGCALTVFIEEDGTYQDRLRIQKIVPFDVIADGTAEEVEQSRLTFAKWMHQRLHEGLDPKEDNSPAVMALAADNEVLRHALDYALNQWRSYADPSRKEDGYPPIGDPSALNDSGDEEAKVFAECVRALTGKPS